jgi:hypothetical protein
LSLVIREIKINLVRLFWRHMITWNLEIKVNYGNASCPWCVARPVRWRGITPRTFSCEHSWLACKN